MNVIEQKAQFGVSYDVGYDAFTCHPKDFLTAGIDWFERWDAIPGVPPASHALKIIGKDRTVEALADGVVYGKLCDYLKDKDCALMVRKPKGWTPSLGDKMAREAVTHIGERYNYFLIVMLAIANTFLGHWIDKLTNRQFSTWLEKLADSKRASICSQLVARVNNAMPQYQGKGVLALPPYKVTPMLLIADTEIYEPGIIELLP